MICTCRINMHVNYERVGKKIYTTKKKLIKKKVTHKKGWKETFYTADFNKIEQRERINETKAFNGNSKPHTSNITVIVNYANNSRVAIQLLKCLHIKRDTVKTTRII